MHWIWGRGILLLIQSFNAMSKICQGTGSFWRFLYREVSQKNRKFTEKHLCQSLNKVLGLRAAILLKRNFGKGVFLWILQNFQEYLFTKKLWTIASVNKDRVVDSGFMPKNMGQRKPLTHFRPYFKKCWLNSATQKEL